MKCWWRRKNINLVNAVGEADFSEHPVDFSLMTKSCFDFSVDRCNYIFAKGMIYQLILLFKFFLILRFKIFSALFQHLIIYFISMFYTCKTIRRIFFIEMISSSARPSASASISWRSFSNSFSFCLRYVCSGLDSNSRSTSCSMLSFGKWKSLMKGLWFRS